MPSNTYSVFSIAVPKMVLYEKAQDEVLKKAAEPLTMILVTGMPGAGVSTFTSQLRAKFPNHDYLKPDYKYFRVSKTAPNLIQINETVLHEFIKDNDLHLPSFIEKVKHCKHGTVVIMEVKYVWYNTYVRATDENMTIIDLSSEEYKLSRAERRNLLNNLCKEMNIGLKQLSNTKRKRIANFEGKHCGFPLLCRELCEELSKCASNATPFPNPLQFMKEEVDEKHK